MAFHSVIYERLKVKDPRVAAAFLRDYKSFASKRSLLPGDTFKMVTAYFFSVFVAKPGVYSRELRCVTGNQLCHLWLEDFDTVLADSYVRDYDALALTGHSSSALLAHELGELLGAC